MTLAVGLLLAAAMIGWVAPRYLSLAVTPGLRPGLALAGWVASAVTMLFAIAAAAVLLVLPGSTDFDRMIGVTESCLHVFRAGGDVTWGHMAALGGAAMLTGLLGWTAVVAVRRLRGQRRWRRRHLTLLRMVCRCDSSVIWLEEPAPVAYSIGGRRGAIVATAGLHQLTKGEREAVLAHERAHLRGRHHLLVLAAEVLAAALPFVPLCRRAPATVRVLVELAADAAAARRHGPDPVRAALLAVSTSGAPQPALAMSREAVEVRLAWLSHERAAVRRLPVRLDYALAAVLAALPAFAVVAATGLAVALYCLGVAG
ncbi:hypothetical protein FHU38_000518 [Saccharomonospora amisosensis]|uniref:Peptidase M48 domain-containing protein n=1 Tax=Saccharomonospora amisosensis TaxID=1128677 RepID=A0A7X5ULF2_9PSEU|nr:M56 family metallopeptidase [Saccharomonospora amisosensis]NIJ10174.1 hypothetical protein [Saccharomonospora amisosensis]